MDSSPFGLKNKTAGIGLIEVLVGSLLMLMVFAGVFGLIQLGIQVVVQVKARVTATTLANQKIELARNLPYDQVGTINGIPSGAIPETEIITRNNIAYTVKTTVVYIDDPFDNLFPTDPLAWDYKRVKVKVSWPGFLAGQVLLLTDISPKGVETIAGGGIISILVFDADGQPVPQADIRVENDSAVPSIDANYQTDNQGRLFLPGAPTGNECYKITASKTGYSSERTYAVGEQIRGKTLAAPSKPFLSVIEGQLSEISFTIDQLASKTIQTRKYVEEKTWSDSFEDESKISEKFQVIASSTTLDIRLAEEQEGQFFSAGYLLSATITPSALVEWGWLNWSDETPEATEIKYQLLYFDVDHWALIPDDDLTVESIANSQGFSAPPVNLSQLDPLKYPLVKIKGNFSTTDLALTPILSDWQIAWFSSDTNAPVPNLAFVMAGAKILGLDSDNQPIAKYQENLSSDSNGQKIIPDLEWDSYTITVNGLATGYDIANSSPFQPVNINPDTDQTTILKLAVHSTHTLLVTVKNSADQALAGASVRLYRTGYDKTKFSSESGQVFFSSLTQASYNLEIELAGFQDWSGQVAVSGQTEQIAVMTPP